MFIQSKTAYQSWLYTSNCLVPCGILHVCRIEMGILYESLAKKSGNVSIELK
jgi:hypothetical protein